MKVVCVGVYWLQFFADSVNKASWVVQFWNLLLFICCLLIFFWLKKIFGVMIKIVSILIDTVKKWIIQSDLILLLLVIWWLIFIHHSFNPFSILNWWWRTTYEILVMMTRCWINLLVRRGRKLMHRIESQMLIRRFEIFINLSTCVTACTIRAVLSPFIRRRLLIRHALITVNHQRRLWLLLLRRLFLIVLDFLLFQNFSLLGLKRRSAFAWSTMVSLFHDVLVYFLHCSGGLLGEIEPRRSLGICYFVQFANSTLRETKVWWLWMMITKIRSRVTNYCSLAVLLLLLHQVHLIMSLQWVKILIIHRWSSLSQRLVMEIFDLFPHAQI